MSEPMNGAVIGSGERKSAPPAPETGAKDQFEQEGETTTAEFRDDGILPPEHRPPSRPHEHRGDPVKLKEVADIMTDLMSADLTDLRITQIGVELNGGQKLRITFGTSRKDRSERSRTLVLSTADGTWSYEA